ncbi:interleukin-23 receptor [Parambassis ranga]|uniref:Interleukin-12 receptor subunit beta-2-like n=1 Tax=Parambassis ranga TaxID=210632 RepID=A0A6P7IH28_9TELE|nr:interleukin-12 receptor subunit beta-2-like [Parambassis ranga]XP_028259645.1 interleukin-12 receptor subunit beta-2-like [Parambassis ranga]
MNLSSVVCRCVLMLIYFSIKGWPLLPAELFIGLGYLTVEPLPPFLLGSNLTVYCHVTKDPWRQEGPEMSLVLNGETVDMRERVNRTTTMFILPSLQRPASTVFCKLSGQGKVVNGLDLRAGLPPDKPAHIICETQKSSDLIYCSWERGQETYLIKSYNISVSRENGSLIHFHHIQNAEETSIPRSMLEDDTKYLLTVTAYNHFGASPSDPFILSVKDVVIPETPQIVQIEFKRNSTAAVLEWKTNETSVHLRPCVRLSADSGSWKVTEGTELSEGLIRVDNLRPLTEYEFQMKACHTTSSPTPAHTPGFMTRLTPSRKSLCSKWSSSLRRTSPGRGPSQQLQVWRKLGNQGVNGLQNVTVLWKPLPSEEYSGTLLEYKIILADGQKHEDTCAAALSQCSVQVPAEVQSLSVSALTLYGASPQADVTLRQSGGVGPVVCVMAPAASDSTLWVSWSWLGSKHKFTLEGELLYYVTEWMSVPAAGLQWQKLNKDLQNTSITGLAAGVRYNVSLYAVTTRGVSAPSSILVYSREQKPLSAPTMCVLVHVVGRILVQWDELPVEQQRGFIIKHTIYFHTLDSSNTEVNMSVPGSGPRQMWLDCPAGALVLQLSASTSAGEGPRGIRISSQPAAPAVGLVIVIVFIIMVFIATVANLLCWSCVRERIKQKCASWGLAWFVEKLPKPGRSNAIRLLQNDGSEPLFSSIHSDPPLSPITVISQEERDEVYPIIHVDVSQTEPGHTTMETASLMSDTRTMFADSQLEHVNYKPQLATLALQGEEGMEAEENQEEESCSDVFEGFLGGLLLSVDVDSSDPPQGLTLGSVSELLWSKTAEPSLLNSGEQGGTDGGLEADCPSLDVQQDDPVAPDTTESCLSQYTCETSVNGGYFPQTAAVSSTTQ